VVTITICNGHTLWKWFLSFILFEQNQRKSHQNEVGLVFLLRKGESFDIETSFIQAGRGQDYGTKGQADC